MKRVFIPKGAVTLFAALCACPVVAAIPDMKDSAMDRIGETTGGKIAASTKAREAADKAGGEAVQVDEDSLPAGSKSADAESEIAAFRDRSSKT